MVICKYFLTNSCNFGSQCKNEHINVATVVKTDTEAAIKGKQWPLSTYGPFKDKASLPNFEDQSFEEIRALCYEAKNAGSLRSLLPQLSQQATDASYKMSMLLDLNNVNNNMLNMLVNLYNSGEPTSTNQPSLSGGNPFAVSSVSGGQSNLFGSSTATQQNPFGNSVFGAASTPSSNVFGGGTSNGTNSFFSQSTNTFGGGGNTTSVFGGQSTFGGTTSNSNVFGGTTAFGQSNPSPFSLPQIGQSAESNSKPSSIFGASQFQQTQTSIFGAPAFGNQIVQPTKPSGLFSSANAALPTSSMFGQTQNNASTGLFGQSHSNQPAGGGGSLFGSSSFGGMQQPPIQQPQQQGIFGAATENMFESGSNNSQSIFGANQQQSSNIFASAMAQQQTNTQNVFGISQSQQEQSNIFNKPNINSTASNIFQNQASAGPATGTIFGVNTGLVNQTAFSRLEDLTPEDLDSFRAETFEIGRIPTVPPPQEVCM